MYEKTFSRILLTFFQVITFLQQSSKGVHIHYSPYLGMPLEGRGTNLLTDPV